MTVRAALLAGAIGAAAAMLPACGDDSARKPAALPLSGKAPGGQRYRLEADRSRGQVPSSWCLRLRYTGDIVVDGDPFTGGLRTCGPAPAPVASGSYAIACARETMYVFGGVRGDGGDIELVPRDGDVIHPRTAALPPRAGFSGTTFLVVSGLEALPATLRRRDHADLVRFPAREEVCVPMGGAPEGAEPAFGDFAER